MKCPAGVTKWEMIARLGQAVSAVSYVAATDAKFRPFLGELMGDLIEQYMRDDETAATG